VLPADARPRAEQHQPAKGIHSALVPGRRGSAATMSQLHNNHAAWDAAASEFDQMCPRCMREVLRVMGAEFDYANRRHADATSHGCTPSY
jgi:hypothetical protein